MDSYFGPTKNPWRSGLNYQLRKPSSNDNIEVNNKPLINEDFFVAGGSSGGAAVAVASGSCFGYVVQY